MKKKLMFFGFVGIGLFFFWDHIETLASLSMLRGHAGELYSHFLLIPVISAYLFWIRRREIFRDSGTCFGIGLAVVAGGALIYLIGLKYRTALNDNDYLSVVMFATVVWFIGGFVMFYGLDAFRKAVFPLLFLLFMVPIPMFILDPYVAALQKASAEVSYAIFKLIGIPIFREGYTFELSGITVHVARECSGIRSSIALFITAVLAGYMFLETGWRRIVLVISSFPIAVIKNAFRIVTISLLASYVDKAFITNHWLHRSGGLPFFVLGMVLFFLPLLLWLRVSEKKSASVKKGENETPANGT